MSSMTRYSQYTVKWVSLPWERAQAYALRQRVFCQEQGLFSGHDQDEIDPEAQLLVVVGGYSGWHEQVVGTVRIHEQASGIWHGSRLAVDADFRHQGHLGSALIRLAVSSAHALGCREFYAHVQPQNELLFQRMHWQSRGAVQLCGRPHVWMQADLAHYPPCSDPYSGQVLCGRAAPALDELAPALLVAASALGSLSGVSL